MPRIPPMPSTPPMPPMPLMPPVAPPAAPPDDHRAAEDPSVAVMRVLFVEPFLVATIHALHRLGAWGILASRGPLGLHALATACGADAAVLQRLLRMACACRLVHEDDDHAYRSSPTGLFLGGPEGTALLAFHQDVTVRATAHLPGYVEARSRDPHVGTGWEHLTGQPYMTFLRQQPQVFARLNQVMAWRGRVTGRWTTWYPTRALADSVRPGGVALVDVAGGVGGDLTPFADQQPQLRREQLVLQDLPEVLDRVSPACRSRVSCVPYDMFHDVQPVRGARAYYCHCVFHNWSDDECVELLARLRPAMEPGYSQLLIHEIVLPPASERVTPTVAMTDLYMMFLTAARERTRAEFDALLQRGGFQIVETVHTPHAQESMIVAVVPCAGIID